MDQEKRKSNVSSPPNLEEMLNEAQQQALPGMKYSGWEPLFLRKKMFQTPELLMKNSSDGRTRILDVNGRIRTQYIKVREQESETKTQSPSNIYLY